MKNNLADNERVEMIKIDKGVPLAPVTSGRAGAANDMADALEGLAGLCQRFIGSMDEEDLAQWDTARRVLKESKAGRAPG